MKYSNTIFHQLLNIIPYDEVNRISKKYNGNKWYRKFNTWNHLSCLIYTQIKQRESLRDIELSLASQYRKLYHLGITSVKKSTFADANQKRDYHIFEELFWALHRKYSELTQHKFKGIDQQILAIDASVIQLTYSLYPWAHFQREKGGIKIHVGYDLVKQLPEFMVVSEAKTNERLIAPTLNIKPDSIIMFDRGYFSSSWFKQLQERNINFVTRWNNLAHYEVTGQLPLDKSKSNIIKDEIIRFKHKHTLKNYPHKLRLITVWDDKSEKQIPILTNIFHLDTQTVALLYRSRWQIELFFKWMKQHLKIKSFLGTSKNAVLSQLWSSMITFLLLQYLKFQTKYKASLLSLNRIISETLFERSSLINILNLKPNQTMMLYDYNIPLPFF